MEKNYNEKMIRKKILSAREHSGNDLLGRERQQISEKSLTFNIIYYLVFQNVRRIKEDLQSPVTCFIFIILTLSWSSQHCERCDSTHGGGVWWCGADGVKWMIVNSVL